MNTYAMIVALLFTILSIDFILAKQCPDAKSKCQDDSTCCQITREGTYGCCPFANAICCEDLEHCCPNGYQCNIQEQKCTKSNGDSLPFTSENGNFYPIKNDSHHTYKSIVCPDGISFCPSQYTCCVMANGKYGCCPLDNAVCCNDHVHCCPQGTTCDVQKQCCVSKLNERELYLEWNEKVTAHLLIRENEDLSRPEPPVTCPDQTSCPPLSHCCEFLNGHYGCCPYKDGVCCRDEEFCCPSGMICGKTKGECLNKHYLTQFNWHTVELEAKVMFMQEDTQILLLKDYVCPGGDVKCSNGTCCSNSDSTYACCPYSNGTCCGSHGYCCPEEYDCDPKLEACIYKGDDKHLDKNVCLDFYTKCDSSCCPLPDAVCCPHKTNFCCPKDYKCIQSNDGKIQCAQGDDLLFDAVERISMKKR